MNEELETEKKNAKATDIMLPIADRGTSLLPNEPARTDDISFEIMKQEISDLTLKLVMKTDELKEVRNHLILFILLWFDLIPNFRCSRVMNC